MQIQFHPENDEIVKLYIQETMLKLQAILLF